jgi:ADP-heptose:LPS heptosyltransferase
MIRLKNIMKKTNFKKTYTLPFKFKVANTAKNILKKNTYPSSKIKFIKRYWFLKIKHQSSLEVDEILLNHHKILWINISAPSLGDSLMDLSSRGMLCNKHLDLFTSKKNAEIYLNDAIFSSVFTKAHEIEESNYDLVILDSYSTRSVQIKVDVAPKVNFVGMFGFYNGPEVNRVLFSFHRMNSLLGYIKSENEINLMAKTQLNISDSDKEVIESYNLPTYFVAIVVGGEWDFRTFNKWALVVEKLFNLDKGLKIILIGSKNGIDMANSIINKNSKVSILNFVAKLSFIQTAEVINQAKYVISCDGGLMHVANAVNTPLVLLLARLDKSMMLTKSNNSFTLFDISDVNNIPVERVIDKCREASNKLRK